MGRMVRVLALLLIDAAIVLSQRTCTWSINQRLPAIKPLYIKPGGSKDILGFWLPQSEKVVSVLAGEKVLFACPGSRLTIINTKSTTLTCVGGNNFSNSDNTSTYKFNDIGCTKIPESTAARGKGTCSSDGSYSLIKIGFEVGADFYKMQETCFNKATAHSLYSVFLQTKEIKGRQTMYLNNDTRLEFKITSDFYTGVDLNYLYSKKSQTTAVARAVGLTALAEQYIIQSNNTGYFLSRGHLTAKADYVYESHQRATFWFMNVAPQWQTFNDGNWKTLEQDVRKYSARYDNNLLVYTGTHGTTTLADKNGNQVPIYLGKSFLKVPCYFWKVLYDPITKMGVAFVGLNNPYTREDQENIINSINAANRNTNPKGSREPLQNPACPNNDNPKSFFPKCGTDCNSLSWLTWAPNNKTLGFGYCYKVDCLKSFIPEIPPLTIKGLLT